MTLKELVYVLDRETTVGIVNHNNELVLYTNVFTILMGDIGMNDTASYKTYLEIANMEVADVVADKKNEITIYIKKEGEI